MKKLSQKRPLLIGLVIVVLLAVALASFFIYSSVKGEPDHKKCPEGESFMYVGNPAGMTDSEIEAESACHPDDGVY